MNKITIEIKDIKPLLNSLNIISQWLETKEYEELKNKVVREFIKYQKNDLENNYLKAFRAEEV